MKPDGRSAPKVRPPKLTHRQLIFLDEWEKDFNGARAAKIAFPDNRNPEVYASKLLNGRDFPLVAAEAQRRRDQQQQAATMTVAEIREMIHQGCNVCPTDHFLPSSEGGEWNTTEQALRALPFRVKRLISEFEVSSVETETKDGTKVRRSSVRVKMVSKDICFNLAARYGLTEKKRLDVNSVDWSKVVQDVVQGRDVTVDEVEEELRKPLLVGHQPTEVGDGTHEDLLMEIEADQKQRPPVPSTNGVHREQG